MGYLWGQLRHAIPLIAHAQENGILQLLSVTLRVAFISTRSRS